ncbi:hypothetical protein P2G88_00050 [Aliiglaciecola sp. CAU 1673]|uniref:hypothetical protein n=1 Tax=Aliiglaciecola sp. CAU 1673 TaxID=3032595 RepID=UPI0023DC8884|nr:hypothetical protein [Aliiglaciecola sp. CAU 1673]MDF2176637.1 hypothetical protein [Aliiglaciecola sp. CAU 1673]
MSPESTLRIANFALLLFFLAFCVSVVLAYGFESQIPMIVVALLHVAQLVLAGLVKVAYVVRLVSQKQLGMEVC